MSEPDLTYSNKLHSTLKINEKTIALIQVFVGNTNNHLMNLSVSGDDILRSAKLMNDAHELLKILEKLK